MCQLAVDVETYRVTTRCLIVTAKLSCGSKINYSSDIAFADSIQEIYESIIQILTDTVGYVIGDNVILKAYRSTDDLLLQFNGKESVIDCLQKKVEQEFAE